jgi:hypothetical protein
MYHDLGFGPITDSGPRNQTVPWNPNLPVPATTTPRINAPASIDAAGGLLRGVLDIIGSARRRTSASQPAPAVPAPMPVSAPSGVSPVVLAGGFVLLAAVLLMRD